MVKGVIRESGMGKGYYIPFKGKEHWDRIGRGGRYDYNLAFPTGWSPSKGFSCYLSVAIRNRKGGDK